VTGEVYKNKINKNEAILEIGSGFGTITRLLLKLFKGPITCYELDSNCIEKLKDLKKSLNAVDSERLTITNNLNQFLKTKNHLLEKKENKSIKFHGIIIDGPVLGKDLYNSIRQSTELRFVFIERYRLIQRAQVSYFLLRCGFQQQYLETRHNSKVTGAFFIVDVCTNTTFSRNFRSSRDFVITSLQLYPKLLKNLAQSRGRNIKVGTYKENSLGITQKIQE
jgi:hypothetical protein